MKFAAVGLVILGLVCSSTLAVGQGPVPFRSMMQSAGAQTELSQTSSSDVVTRPLSQTSDHRSMTAGGKVMMGAGIGLLVVGGLTVMTAIAFHDWGDSGRVAAVGGVGAGVAAGGVTLMVVGAHRRTR